MSEENDAVETPDAPEQPESSDSSAGWRNMLKKHWVAVFMLAMVVGHTALLFYVRAKLSAARGPESLEVTLGEFDFDDPTAPDNHVAEAHFRLHISLLSAAAQNGRRLLLIRENKVQQEVEQLLRETHSRDFDDPRLVEMKRQMQELINEILGSRVVEEVIITDMTTRRMQSVSQPTSTQEAAVEAAWQQNDAS